MKNLLLVALMFIGLNTFAQKPNLPQDEMRRELRDLRFGGYTNYEPLRGRIIIYPATYRSRTIIYRNPATCRRCVKNHNKHRRNGIFRKGNRSLHQPAQRRNFKQR